MTGPERRRRWGDDERLQVLEAACAPGAIVADVSRRYDVCASLIYKWLRASKAGAPAAFKGDL
jgi:transposase